MSNEILDEEFNGEISQPHKTINYLGNSIKYVVLMALIGCLLTNLLIDRNLNILQLLVGASTYIIMGISISSTIELIRFVYRKIRNKDNNQNPIWYNILENGFYFWCVIVVITFTGNFLI